MDRLVRFFVERHLLVTVVTLAMVAIGTMTALRIPMEGFPVFDLPTFFVRAQLPGASARDVETKLTIPIEKAVAELDNVRSYQTNISENVSFTVVELYYDLDRDGLDQAERDLRTELDAITDFPDEMVDEPVIERLNRGRFPILQIALAGPSELLPGVRQRLKSTLDRLDRVSEVRAVGLHDPEIRILVDPDRAREHGVTLSEVAAAIAAHNVSSTGGILETNSVRRQVVLWNRLENPEDVADVLLRFSREGGAVRVRDVARIESMRTSSQRGVSPPLICASARSCSGAARKEDKPRATANSGPPSAKTRAASFAIMTRPS